VPASYTIDKERGLVISTATGVLTRADILGHQQHLVKDPDFNPSLSQISDFTTVTGLDLRAADVEAVAERNMFSPGSRRALLVKTDEQFGLARMFASLRDAEGEHGIRVFRDREQAMNWVLAKEKVSDGNQSAA
jgi:hypothetical protein